MCKQTELRHFRTITGPARKQAIRVHLQRVAGIAFNADVHTLSFAQRDALATMAKAVSWRKSISSPMSLGSAFFVYLSRGAA